MNAQRALCGSDIELECIAHSVLNFLSNPSYECWAIQQSIKKKNSTTLDIHDCSDRQCEVQTPANAMVEDSDICKFIS